MRLTIFIFLFFIFAQAGFCQQSWGDTLVPAIIDSVVVVQLDTSFFSHTDSLAKSSSFLFNQPQILYKTGIEFFKNTNEKKWIYYWILFSIVLFFLIKMLYSRYFEQFLAQLIDASAQPEFGRTKGLDLSLFQLLFLFFSIVNFSILLTTSFSKNAPNTIVSALFVSFLFTFFVVIKVMFVQFLSFVFAERESGNEYLFYFFQVVQIVGVASFPAVVIMSVQSKINLEFFTIYTSILLVFSILFFLFKGLSTMLKLLYKSVYHFLLYICVGEILSVFLFIKLLTKTAF